MALLRENRLQEAKALLEKLCGEQQCENDILFLLGVVNGRQDQWDDALACWNKILQAQPNDAGLLFNIGQAYLKKRQYNTAETFLRRVVNINPKMVQGWHILAIVCQEQGKIEAAIEYFQTGLNLSPNDPQINNNLGNALLKANRLKEAVSVFSRVVEEYPDYAVGNYNLGKALLLIGRMDDALVYFQKARQLNSSFVAAAAGEATVYQRQGHFKKAYELLSPLVESGVNHIEVLTNFARISKELGKGHQIVALLEETVKTVGLSDSDRSDLHFTLGGLYDALKDYDTAFDHFSKANNITGRFFDIDVFTAWVDNVITVYN